MKSLLCALICSASVSAQTFTITDAMQWKAYDDFNAALLDKTLNIYKVDTEQKSAHHRGNGARDNDKSGCAAAIWCQAIYYDMVINAYNRAKTEGNKALTRKYKKLHDSIFKGEKEHYVNFNFHDSNTNNGWFVYDDIMWWTCALARAYQTFGKAEYLTLSEKSFCRVWYGSAIVGDVPMPTLPVSVGVRVAVCSGSGNLLHMPVLTTQATSVLLASTSQP